ncbi:unnamed protein product [Linum trigynum]|uniref:Uncharacterized protein n=1 Tax=Linum trigynum TaxID=586398 RepID=A0AAV2DC38_9ROSI
MHRLRLPSPFPAADSSSNSGEASPTLPSPSISTSSPSSLRGEQHRFLDLPPWFSSPPLASDYSTGSAAPPPGSFQALPPAATSSPSLSLAADNPSGGAQPRPLPLSPITVPLPRSSSLREPSSLLTPSFLVALLARDLGNHALTDVVDRRQHSRWAPSCTASSSHNPALIPNPRLGFLLWWRRPSHFRR